MLYRDGSMQCKRNDRAERWHELAFLCFQCFDATPQRCYLVVMQLTRVATACCLYVAAKLGRMPWWVDVRGRM